MTRDLVVAEAERMRRLGYNPLPSHPKCGHPPFSYGTARDQGMSAHAFEKWLRVGCLCIQVATGSIWGLAVVDIDGQAGMRRWNYWSSVYGVEPTWTVKTPRDGYQLWFDARDMGPIPTGELFRPDPKQHQGIELIGDGFLARTPPSYKVIDGTVVPYKWVYGRDPDSQPMARLPRWVLDIREASRPKDVLMPVRRNLLTPVVSSGTRFGRAEVIGAIPDKLSIAKSWGLRVDGERWNSRGWIKCRSIYRPDNNPSAGFGLESGNYWEPKLGRLPLSFFDLAVELGVYSDFSTACNHLGSIYLGRKAS